MKRSLHALTAVALLTAAPWALSQNVAIVNGKAVPLARVEALAQQVAASGRPVDDTVRAQLKEEVVLREIFMQEAQKRGVGATEDFKTQMELARQTIMIRTLFADYQKKNPITDKAIQAEYDKFVAANGGKEFRARHILVESEDEAKAIVKSIKGGAKFEDIAKKQSKDPGSGANGGDRVRPMLRRQRCAGRLLRCVDRHRRGLCVVVSAVGLSRRHRGLFDHAGGAGGGRAGRDGAGR